MKKQSFSHVPELDGIRAIAVSLVIVGHLGLRNFVPAGFGVTIFFFLSGFLITSLMRSEFASDGKVSLPSFFLRRTLRILPPLYITFIFALLLAAFHFIKSPETLGAILLQATFLHNYENLFGYGYGVPIPLWSLHVEEHFYLLFPLLFSALYGRFGPKRLALLCAGLCVVALAFRFQSYSVSSEFAQANYTMSHTRMDSILFGCILALWNNPLIDEKAFRPTNVHVAAATALLLSTFLIRDDFFRQTVRYSIQGIALFVLFSFALQAGGIVRKILSCRAAQIVGLLSYTIYLVHMIFIALLETLLPEMSALERAIPVIMLTFAYSAAMYVAVERPLARLRKSLASRQFAASQANCSEKTGPA